MSLIPRDADVICESGARVTPPRSATGGIACWVVGAAVRAAVLAPPLVGRRLLHLRLLLGPLLLLLLPRGLVG